MEIESVVKAGVVLASPLLSFCLNFWWSNIRLHAKRLQVIDFAIKRTAFWDQILKVELTAAPESEEQKQAKERAYRALQQIRADADREMERLAWNQEMRQRMIPKGKPLSRQQRLLLLFTVVPALYFTLVGILVGVLFFLKAQNAIGRLASFAIMTFFWIAASFFGDKPGWRNTQSRRRL